jgi:hypothetical protein
MAKKGAAKTSGTKKKGPQKKGASKKGIAGGKSKKKAACIFGE